MSCVMELLELQDALSINACQYPFEKLNIILICVMPLMVPTLRSTEHVNFVRSTV